IPVPRPLDSDPTALLQMAGDPLSHRFGGALNRRFAQANSRRFPQQLRPLVEAVGDGAAQGAESLDRRRQSGLAEADALVPRRKAMTRGPTVVMGRGAGPRPADRFDRFLAVGVEAGGVAAVRTVATGADVATFFSRCSA